MRRFPSKPVPSLSPIKGCTFPFMLMLVVLVQLLSKPKTASSFVLLTRTETTRTIVEVSTQLYVKKKKKASSGQGFGKQKLPEQATLVKSPSSTAKQILGESARSEQQSSSSSYLSSVDDRSTSLPTIVSTKSSDADFSKSIEERKMKILRETYGMKTEAEKETERLKLKQIEDQRAKINKWKQQANDGQDFDLLQILPDPVLIFIDRFLKFGVGVTTTLFVSAGIAITVEAGSKATKNPLPSNIDDFISNVVEPNFTPGLLFLLSFSVALGLFASLQLNSASSTYREK